MVRWKFGDSPARQATISRIDAFWKAFIASRSQLDDVFRGAGDFDVVNFMSSHFHPIHPEMMWEFGRALDVDGHRLVVTPEPRHELTELARTIVERAPKGAGWEFYVHRLPESYDSAVQSVAGRTGGDISDATLELSVGDGHLIDVGYTSASSSRDHDAFLALEALLGESTLNAWVGVVSARKPKRFGRSDGFPISEVADRFATLQGQIRSSLPDSPYIDWLSDETEMSLLSAQPQQATDYARQDDRITTVSPSFELSKAAQVSDRFWSERFSRHGEVFAYVKIDGSEGLEGSGFEDREAIENVLDAALRPNRVGCVLGAGNGARYSYVDLALLDVEAAIAATTSALSDGRIPKRSWVLFYDREWSDEWVGVYAETPPPPTVTR